MEKQLKKVLFITNIPAPYRIDFYNELGKYCNLTVIFEAKRAHDITFNWKDDFIHGFNSIFLKDGEIQEKKIDWSIFKYITNLNFDKIVITNYAYATEMIALLSLKIRRIPYYYEIDGAMVNYNEPQIKKIIKRFFLSGAKAYISPSKISDQYVRYYAGKNVKIYRYPFTSLSGKDFPDKIPTKEQKECLRKQLGVHEEKMVLAVGQFIHRKGFDILLKAALKFDSSIGIYIVGGKPTKEYLNMQKSLNLWNVHFEGFKSKEELSKYYSASDIFVHPTREDIWGLVINEAMGFGLPVITTNKCVAGMELLPTDCIIETENGIVLAKKISMLLNDEQLMQKLSKRNYNKSKEYTIENMVKTHREILQL